MIINGNNYEIWFIEFFEGNLNPEEEKELFVFLEKNPGKKIEFDALKRNTSNNCNTVYKKKNALKKEVGDLGPVTDQTIDEYSVAYLENDLDENGKASLMEAIQENKDYLKTFKLYQFTKLTPDLRIVYKYKSRLKHFVFERKTVTRVLGYLSAAVFLSFTLFFFVNDNNDITQKPVVSKIIDDNEPTHQTKSTEIIPSSNDLRGAGSGSTKKQGMISKEKQVPKHVRPVENSISKVMVNSKSRREVKGEERLLTRLDPKLINKIYYEGQPLPMDLKVPSKRSNSRIVDKRDFIHPTNQVNDGKITIWKIAEIGLNGFNKLNETNYMLQKNYNASGELTSVSLITNQRIITTSAI